MGADTLELIEHIRQTAVRFRRGEQHAGDDGAIAAVRVEGGGCVAKGDVLVVVEAMKMEHAVRAPKDGTVERVLVSEGQMVGLGDVLVEMA